MPDESTALKEPYQCPMCKSSDLTEISSIFIQCNHCKILIDFTNDKLHVTECPLCGSQDLTPLPSGNILCEGCKNSFVAAKINNF
jgi:ribosomal protein L37AE/L43A